MHLPYTVATRWLGALALAGLLAACGPAPTTTTPTQAGAPATSAPAATAAPAPTDAPTAPATSAPAPTNAPEPTGAPAAAGVLPAPLYMLDDKQQIVRLEPDGKTITPVTKESATVGQLAISPADGTLLYTLQQDAGAVLVRADALGGSRAEIASGIISSPVWAPDGQRYAISWANGPEGSGVYSAPAQGSAQPTLLLANLPFPQGDGEPGLHYIPVAWSPDGGRLLLATAPDNGPSAPAGDIAVLGAAVLGSDGKATTLVGTGGDPYMCFSAVWVGDGSQVACSSYGTANGMPAMWSIPAAGGEPKVLIGTSKDGGQVDVFSMAPIGGQLHAFVGTAKAVGEAPTYRMQRIDPATGAASNLRDDVYAIDAVLWSAWAPDGSGAVIQQPQASDPQHNRLIWAPANGGAPAELALSGQGAPVWGIAQH